MTPSVAAPGDTNPSDVTARLSAIGDRAFPVARSRR